MKEAEPELDTSKENDKVILDIPARVKYLEIVGECLDSVLDRAMVSEDDQSRFAIKLGVHETCANIIEHGYAGTQGRIRIEIQVIPNNSSIVVELFDRGVPAELDQVAVPNLEKPQIKGYGLFLIRSLVDELGYSRKNGINRWTIVKTL
jgi:serine/threonine-protein kinase RsbW